MKYVKEVMWMILFCSAFLSAQKAQEVRSPAVAGMFYPDNAAELTRMIHQYLSKAEMVIDGEIGGLISPMRDMCIPGQWLPGDINS